MALTAPRGGPALAEYRLALAIANSAEWIDWCDAVDSVAALQSIYYADTPLPSNNKDHYSVAELQAMRPFAVISTLKYRMESNSDTGWQDYGRLQVLIEDNVPAEIAGDRQEIARRFLNRIGGLLGTVEGVTGLTDLAGRSPDVDHIYLDITNIEMSEIYEATEKEAAAQGNHVYMLLTIDWGSPP